MAFEQLTEFPNVTNTLPVMTEHSVKKSAPWTFLGLSFGGFTFQAVPNFRTTMHSTHTQCLWRVASSVLTSTLTTSLSHRKHFHSSHPRLHDYKQRGGAQRSLSSDQPQSCQNHPPKELTCKMAPGSQQPWGLEIKQI